MTEERLKKRQVENGILANAKNDPACVANDALFSGKIVSVYKRGDETKFIVTCGHPGMKRNADGKIDRNIITVKFFGKEGEFYACLLYTSPSPRDLSTSRMPSSA